ncbi:MAG TPA: phosphatase PAP2 family protein [Mucilaginibacter sp.]
MSRILTGINKAIDSLFGKYQKYHKYVVAYVLGTISVGFIILTALVVVFPRPFIDLEFSQEVQEHQTPLLDNLMKFVSWFGYFPGSAISVLSAALLFLYFKYRREALFILLTSLAGLLSALLKILVNRARPTQPLVRIVQKVNEQSFPSGHVLFYIVFFGFLTVLMYDLKTIPRLIRITVSTISMVLIFIVPFSRIYLGAHWFTDVFGGFLLGVLSLYVLCFFYFRKFSK